MTAKNPFPPVRLHPSLTSTVSPSVVQAQLSAYLAKSKRQPYLHPDATLAASGAQFSASSGPKGGLAIHHLSRVEAGLRGESLVAETAEQLVEMFGEDAGKALGDDGRLDAEIARLGNGTNGSRKSSTARARSIERVSDWEMAGAEEMEDFQQKQKILEGDVADREGAPVVQQNGVVPEVVMADDADVPDNMNESMENATNHTDKAARRHAKKARNKARKLQAANG